MHVLQYLAVKAETTDEAYDLVDSKLQEDMDTGSWYDWYVVGGGRFNVSQDEDWQEAYKNGKTNMIVSSDNVEEFDKIVAELIQYRVDEFERYRAEWKHLDVDLDRTLEGYFGVTDYSMNLYALGKMIDMLQGEWDFNAYFYDLEHWSTNPKYMNDDRNDVGGVWYLVPVDFHY
jgi:hypothetical protein